MLEGGNLMQSHLKISSNFIARHTGNQKRHTNNELNRQMCVLMKLLFDDWVVVVGWHGVEMLVGTSNFNEKFSQH